MVDTLYLSTWTRSLEDYARCCSTTVLKCGCSKHTWIWMHTCACMKFEDIQMRACGRYKPPLPLPTATLLSPVPRASSFTIQTCSTHTCTSAPVLCEQDCNSKVEELLKVQNQMMQQQIELRHRDERIKFLPSSALIPRSALHA
jgi:hypothetical protein